MQSHKKKDNSFRERVDTVKQLLDPSYLVENLGFKILRETAKELRAACSIHGGDNPTSFRFNKDKKTWVCFTHKCHELFGNDMFGLVRCVNDCSFMDALDYLEELTGSKSINKAQLVQYKQKRERQEFMSLYGDNNERPSIVDETRLKYYKPYRSALFEDEGFAKETLDHFDIAGGYTDAAGLVRDIIPIRNVEGSLVAYSLRDIRGIVAKQDQKYKLTLGFDKDTVLYNMNVAKDYGERVPIVVVEGFKSVWKLHEMGINNVVACMGSGITTGQASLLCTHAHRGVVFFYDNDYAGASAVTRSLELLRGKLKMYIEVITEVDEAGEGLDPADLTEQQLLYYLGNYKENVDGG